MENENKKKEAKKSSYKSLITGILAGVIVIAGIYKLLEDKHELVTDSLEE